MFLAWCIPYFVHGNNHLGLVDLDCNVSFGVVEGTTLSALGSLCPLAHLNGVFLSHEASVLPDVDVLIYIAREYATLGLMVLRIIVSAVMLCC